jgi:hypothetical protein
VVVAEAAMLPKIFIRLSNDPFRGCSFATWTFLRLVLAYPAIKRVEAAAPTSNSRGVVDPPLCEYGSEGVDAECVPSLVVMPTVEVAVGSASGFLIGS